MDLGIGIVLVVLGAVATMGFAAEAFAGRPEFGNFSDAGAVAMRLEKYAGRLPAVLFALAPIDACIIGASAVSLSTAYAIGDVLSLRHSLTRKPNQAKGFYWVYCGLMLMAAVLTPCTPLGLLTNAVQTLAAVLLPSAPVFLLLLCNNKAVLGPWVNTRGINLFTGRGDRCSRDAFLNPDRVGAGPGHRRNADRGNSHRRQRSRRRDCGKRSLRGEPTDIDNAAAWS
jgi:Mn2+/Fe2+ NRAMP family transporter